MPDRQGAPGLLAMRGPWDHLATKDQSAAWVRLVKQDQMVHRAIKDLRAARDRRAVQEQRALRERSVTRVLSAIRVRPEIRVRVVTRAQQVRREPPDQSGVKAR